MTQSVLLTTIGTTTVDDDFICSVSGKNEQHVATSVASWAPTTATSSEVAAAPIVTAATV